ncbi:MAG TPA: ChrR family anti-sigma-E factor [Steroidobacteraceae bacterium]|nr:ChrR family anti-sigma-E factor [Steroidobacteraceae bacterium]
MITHHPGDELLLAWTAGTLDSGRGVVVASHVDLCASCARRARSLLAIGGELLEATEPQALAHDAFARTLQRIDSAAGVPGAPEGREPAARGAEAGSWPRPLGGCVMRPWRWIGPGMLMRDVEVPHQAAGRVFLLKIAAGRSLPEHSHGADEFTQVLAGSFEDGRSVFGPGDFDETGPSVVHRPVVAPGQECICLAYLGAPLRFESRLTRTMARWVGI